MLKKQLHYMSVKSLKPIRINYIIQIAHAETLRGCVLQEARIVPEDNFAV